MTRGVLTASQLQMFLSAKLAAAAWRTRNLPFIRGRLELYELAQIRLWGWIARNSPGHGTIKFVAAAWILYCVWWQGRCVA